MPEVIWDYKIADLAPAEYNPRFLSDEAFERLKHSIGKFGIIKPVIINKDGTIVAGHQRTKALTSLGQETCPVIVLDKKAGMEDEINFNLLHNSIETAHAEVFVSPSEQLGYVTVDWREIQIVDAGLGNLLAACGNLVSKYGTWGSVVADPETGRVIANNDYAVCCSRQRLPLLVYYPAKEHVEELAEIMVADFGVYDPDRVVKEPWSQYAIQPLRRLRGKTTKQVSESVLYREDVIPLLTKEERCADFGAGIKAHANDLLEQGYQMYPYEPFLTMPGDLAGKQFNIPEIVRDMVRMERSVRREGLFPVVVLDSVLNASTSHEYHKYITTVSSALMRPDGRLHLATRNKGASEVQTNSKKRGGSTVTGGRLWFVSPEGRSVGFRMQQWTTIWFHTPDSLEEWLSKYFGEIEWTSRGKTVAMLRCTLRKPKAIDPEQVRESLLAEFNPPYPDGYRHNRHEGLVEALMARYMETYEERVANGIVE